MTDPIKPCPFCGSSEIDVDEYGRTYMYHNIPCYLHDHLLREKEIEWYNTRPIEDELLDMVKDLLAEACSHENPKCVDNMCMEPYQSVCAYLERRGILKRLNDRIYEWT